MPNAASADVHHRNDQHRNVDTAMTAQNVIFLAILGGIGFAVLFHMNAILSHLPLALGGIAVVLGGLVFATNKGLIDWDEWIPRPRD